MASLVNHQGVQIEPPEQGVHPSAIGSLRAAWVSKLLGLGWTYSEVGLLFHRSRAWAHRQEQRNRANPMRCR